MSFNPCFNGRGVKTIMVLILSVPLLLVSILVLMEEALRLFDNPVLNVSEYPFQSLF